MAMKIGRTNERPFTHLVCMLKALEKGFRISLQYQKDLTLSRRRRFGVGILHELYGDDTVFSCDESMR